MTEDVQNTEVDKQPKTNKSLLDRIGRKQAILGFVLLVVIAVGGAGMWQWHETPQFCAAFCHNMDEYLDTYEQPQATAGYDKYGNKVSNTNAMMSTLHSSTKTTAMPEIGCMGCHKPVIAEQASEGTAWLVGNYLDPLNERTGEELARWRNVDSTTLCANESCHVYILSDDGKVDYNKLEDITRGGDFNPHAQQHDALTLDCTSCHKGHRASTVVCTGCHEHENIALPDGWVKYSDSQQILEEAFT